MHSLNLDFIYGFMADVTQILNQLRTGDAAAANVLFPIVYDELHRLAAQKMAAERFDHTLQCTALVHEVYLRLIGGAGERHWNDRKHFFATAAEAMRRILIDHARGQRAEKRGGGHRRTLAIDIVAKPLPVDLDLLLDLDEGLSRLANEDPLAAELVKLRVFAGLSVVQAAELLDIPRRTAYRNWEFVRSWFAVFAQRKTESDDCSEQNP